MATMRVTPAAQWRKARLEGHVVRLPSGNVARVRPVPMDLLITGGKIPDILTPIAARALWVDTDAETIGNETEMAKGFIELVNLIAPLALVEPRVVAKPTGDDEIALEDMEFSDRLAVFSLATQPSEVLRRFRDEPAGDVEPVRHGDGDGAETE